MKKRKLFQRRKAIKGKEQPKQAPEAVPTPEPETPVAFVSMTDEEFLSVFEPAQVLIAVRRVNSPSPRLLYTPMGRLNFDDNLTNDEDND